MLCHTRYTVTLITKISGGKKMYKTKELFDTKRTVVGAYLEKFEYPYEIIPMIESIIAEIINTLGDEYTEIKKGVFVSENARISDRATLIGPAIICEGAEIRPNAYIRGNAVIGCGAVIGNATEVKNSIVFDFAQLPHYNYVGDSIIGTHAHFGAGCIASNLRLDKKSIRIKDGEEILDTGLRKLGAIVGDGCEIGCGSVLCPGTVIGKSSIIYPKTTVKGVIKAGAIIK